ncbi:50S ribosomal protein L3 [bacterium]|nr:50S ribosomal protein L3 [bacterium]
MKFILGEKIGMSQLFDEKGHVVPVTWIQAGPCFVTYVKSTKPQNTDLKKGQTETYNAVQIGFKELERKKGKKLFQYLREFRGGEQEVTNYKEGDKIDVSIFKKGDIVKISGISKSKGFQGVVKRWGFKGAPKSHGTKYTLRAPGSIGATDPERVFKGRKMAGRTGGRRVTVKNLKIVKVDKDKNLLAVRGAVPGAPGTLLEIKG